MSKFILAILLMMANSISFAQQTCAAADQSIVIFFGNGINTTAVAAKRSANALRNEIGPTYNGQKVRYDIAYNRTAGMVDDLTQSARQSLPQWDSQVMGWFNGIGVAPDWFNQWYQKFLLSFSTVIASELPEHVERYSAAIALGQKAVVVAHSQGNFYANEAKKLMQQKLPADKMNSFAIFGVAVPSNNVGGASSPYYTNHRDIIYQIVPGALPQNWLLHRANGELETSREGLAAHSFVDTYMSSEFDMKPAMVAGIKAQITATTQPAADCTTYRPQILSMVVGTYDSRCIDGSSGGGIYTVTPTGVVNPGGTKVDMSDPDSIVSLGRDASSGTALSNGVSWDSRGVLNQACASNPPSLAPIHIMQTMMGLLQSSYTLFPRNRCYVPNGDGLHTLPSATPVVFSGTTVYVGNFGLDLGDNVNYELVKATQGNETSPRDYDPGFTLVASRENETVTLLEYRRNKGLRSVSVFNTERRIILSCTF